MNVSADLFPGFAERRIKTDGAEIFVRTGGSGPPLLLLHGYPQTHVCWHKIAPELARHCHAGDRRPARLRRQLRPARRRRAHDLLQARHGARIAWPSCARLGMQRFMVGGHDRGGRVAYRLALDHPEAVSALLPIDILPTAEVWRRVTAERAIGVLSLGVPGAACAAARDADRQGSGLLPRAHAEELDEAARPLAVLGRRRWRTTARCCRSQRACMPSARTTAPAPASTASSTKPTCRPGAKLPARPSCLGQRLPGQARRQPLQVWRAWCSDLSAEPRSTSGHFLAEENPEATLAALLPFLTQGPHGGCRHREPDAPQWERHGQGAERAVSGKACDAQAACVLRPSIALALGGGGARGLAHILMLEVFDELGLKPKIIAGTSIGALFGAAYASGLSAGLIRAHAEQILSQRLDIARLLFAARAEPIMKFLNVLPVRFALLKPEPLLESLLPSRVARDFARSADSRCAWWQPTFTRRSRWSLPHGPLRTAIAASMALPAIFTPVVSEGRTLMDGGLVNPLPFDVIRERGRHHGRHRR